MDDLLTLLREHDLPPFWDGLAVVWDTWRTESTPVFLCPPPKRPATCHGCGSAAEQHQAKGRVARAAFIDHDRIAAEDENRVRLGSLGHKRKPVALVRLFVWRCPDCLLDVVWDIDAGEWFDLDHTDYGPDGSRAP